MRTIMHPGRYEGEDVVHLIIVAQTPLEHRVCFGYLASFLGFEPFDMVTFVSDDRGRWRPKEIEEGHSFDGAFVIIDDSLLAQVMYEDSEGVLHYEPVNAESQGLGVAQSEYWEKHIDPGGDGSWSYES